MKEGGPMKILDHYFEGCKIILIDIETTGLYADLNKVILGGLLPYGSHDAGVIQFFAESKADEQLLLEAYRPFLEDADILVNYNGDSFDIPFLNKRFEINGIQYKIPSYKSFDLYRILRHSSLAVILPNLKQKTVENYLGINAFRTDEISGKESVALYNQYLTTRDVHIKEKILLHNNDDLFQLQSLLPILKKIDLHKAMFHNGFTQVHGSQKIAVTSIQFHSGSLVVHGHHQGTPVAFKDYFSPYCTAISRETGELTIDIPYQTEGTYIFVDLQEMGLEHEDFSLFPGCQSGFLILRQEKEIAYAETNQLVKKICQTILNHFDIMY
jgi:uncharacterized protein YprB with RNaseH-like and TPR domain